MKFREQKSTGTGRSYANGVATVKLVAINPTKEQRNKLTNYEDENEPVYNYVDDNGVKSVNVNVYTEIVLPNGGSKPFRMSFFIKDKALESGEKKKYIDVFGNTTWSVGDPQDDRYFHTGNFRECKAGEEEFMKLFLTINGYPTMKSDATMGFESSASKDPFLDMEQILNNDFSEFNKFLQSRNVEIGVFLSYLVEGEKIRQVWFKDRYLRDENIKGRESLLKQVQNRTGTKKYDFQHSGEVRETLVFVSEADIKSGDAENLLSVEAQAVTPQTVANSNDLPF